MPRSAASRITAWICDCLNLSSYDLAGLGLITATLWGALSVATQRISPLSGFTIAADTMLNLFVGRSVSAIPVRVFRVPCEYLCGFLLVNTLVLAVCLVCTVSAGLAATAVAIFLLGVCARRYTRKIDRHAAGSAEDLILLLVICVASVIWSWQAITSVPHLTDTGVFRAWSDYFIHSGEIAQFAHFGALNGTSIFAGGAPLPIYHYASYILPAALCQLTGAPALVVATAFWTPLGFLLLGLGVGVLGGILAGATGSAMAVVAVLLLPSASHYGLANPFFDFHWLLQISSSGSYALACSCLALTALIIWIRTHSRSSLIWALAISAIVAAFRVQIFCPLIFTEAALFLLAIRPAAWWQRPGAFGLCFMFSCAGALISECLDRAPHLLSGAHHPLQALSLVLGMQPSPYASLFAAVRAAAAPSIALVAGVLLLALAACGAWLPLYFAGLAWRWKKGTLRVEDWLPALALCAYCTIAVVFPDTPLEPGEFSHRPFVFAYVALAVWCSKLAAEVLEGLCPPGCPVRVTGVVSIAFLAVPAALQREVQTSALMWGIHFAATSLPKALLTVAEFIRANSSPGATVASSRGWLQEPLIGISERAEFFPGSRFLRIQSGIPTAEVERRSHELDGLLTSDSSGDLHATAERNDVTWLVTFPGVTPPIRYNALCVAASVGGFAVVNLMPCK